MIGVSFEEGFNSLSFCGVVTVFANGLCGRQAIHLRGVAMGPALRMSPPRLGYLVLAIVSGVGETPSNKAAERVGIHSWRLDSTSKKEGACASKPRSDTVSWLSSFILS